MTTPRMPTAARAALLALGACGAHAPAPQSDFGPPRAPVDPVACPAATLERFAERAAHVATITTEPVLDAARTDKLPCKPAETDAACIARARTRAVPPGYEVTSVTIGGDITHIDFLYDLDGRRITEQASSMKAMVDRLKALQAKGHKVTLLRGESAADTGSRHAAVAYRGTSVRQRRVATLRSHPANPDAVATVVSEIQAAAEHEGLELRRLEVTPDGDVIAVATCVML